MNRDEIIENNPIITFLQDRNYKIKRVGTELATHVCPQVEHGPQHFCVSVHPDKQVWHCNDCDTGGSVIDWVMLEGDLDAKAAMESFGGGGNAPQVTPGMKLNPPAPPSDAKEVAAYNYTDENGKLVFQVVRYEPKTFRQRQPKGSEWQWNLEGIQRVLFNLPEVLKSQQVCITEGEKDAITLMDIGFTATTNAGGSNGWLDAYGDFFKGKDVIVFPDNDPAGQKRATHIVASIKDKANSVKVIYMPDGNKDVSDYILNFEEKDRRLIVQTLIDKAAHAIEPLPIYTVLEREAVFREWVRELPKRCFPMDRVAKGFRGVSDHLGPGEVVMIVGDTSQGKTAVMQHIARVAKPLPTLIFELELPLQKMFLRETMMEVRCFGRDVIKDYQDSDFSISGSDRYENMKHVLICPKSGLSMDTIESYITKSELKFGVHPTIVMVDYMGLVRHQQARSRYEAMAYSAEKAKEVAKNTNTILFMGSQVSRPEGRKGPVHDIDLHHAKGAGELESSANLVLGLARIDRHLLRLKVIKNNDGDTGKFIYFDFDPDKLQIKENEHYEERREDE
jgi:5S rRNA maturation endonuclease (ribonuclease M5)/energy-coupling factor transporter ATP-binding protein EcfA2